MADEKKPGKPKAREIRLPDFLEAPKSAGLVAKKDFVLHHNDFKRVIKVGDDLSDVPERYHQNLKTEGVL